MNMGNGYRQRRSGGILAGLLRGVAQATHNVMDVRDEERAHKRQIEDENREIAGRLAEAHVGQYENPAAGIDFVREARRTGKLPMNPGANLRLPGGASLPFIGTGFSIPTTVRLPQGLGRRLTDIDRTQRLEDEQLARRQQLEDEQLARRQQLDDGQLARTQRLEDERRAWKREKKAARRERRWQEHWRSEGDQREGPSPPPGVEPFPDFGAGLHEFGGTLSTDNGGRLRRLLGSADQASHGAGQTLNTGVPNQLSLAEHGRVLQRLGMGQLNVARGSLALRQAAEKLRWSAQELEKDPVLGQEAGALRERIARTERFLDGLLKDVGTTDPALYHQLQKVIESGNAELQELFGEFARLEKRARAGGQRARRSGS